MPWQVLIVSDVAGLSNHTVVGRLENNLMTPLRADREFAPEDVEAFLMAGYWNDDTLGDWLSYWSEEDPEGAQIIGLEGTLTNREVYDRAQRMAGALLSMGIVKGQAVGIQMANTPEFIITYYGIALMGGVLLTMHMPYRAHEMAPLLNHGRAIAVVCEPATEKYDAPDTMRKLKRVVPTLEHVIVGPGGLIPDDCVSLAEMFQADPGVEINDPPNAADPVLLCFTSGTAAAPKAVLRNYHSALANGRIYGETISIDRQDRIMVVPPFSHVFGLCCLHSGLAYGAPTVLLHAFTPELFVEVVERHQPTLLFSSPAPVAATLKSGLLTGDLVSVRQAVLAGSIVPPAVSQALEERMPNGKVGGLFGMTEIILTTATPLEGSIDERHHSTGRPVRGMEVRVTSPESGQVLEVGEEGELEIRGYSVMSGYLNNAQANSDAFTEDNFFKTGDLAIVDVDQNVRITGRVKDIINRGGVKINPTDIENLIAAHPAVTLAAIAPMGDDIMGEKACLFVTLAPDASLTFDQVIDYLSAAGIAKLRWPERLEVVDDMPMTPTKKVMKHVLTGMVSSRS